MRGPWQQRRPTMRDDRLFSPRTVKGLCAGAKPNRQQREAAEQWLALLETGELASEQKNYLKFANIVLSDILGYPINDLVFEDKVEFQYRGDNGDGGTGVCFEVKGTATKDLFAPQHRAKMEHYTPVKQLWDYMGSTGAGYGICTNYRRFILLSRETGTQRHHEFDFEEVRRDPVKLAEFIAVFSRGSINGGIVGHARSETANEEMELTGEFYELYGQTRLMLVREFEECGAPRDEAVSAAQSFLNRLIFIFFVEDGELVGQKDLFVEGVTDQLYSHLKPKSKRIWDFINGELFDWFNEGSDSLNVAAFNGGLFAMKIDARLHFRDRREKGFFGDIERKTERRSWEFKEKIERAVRRNADVNPVIKNLLALSSYDYASQVRVNILGHIFEHSLTDLEELSGRRTHRRKREGVYYTPEYITRYVCRRTIIPHLSRSGAAEDPASLVAEYADDLGALDDRLARIKILDPACGSGAFLTEAVSTLLDIHRTMRGYKETNGDIDHGTLNPAIDDARIRSIVRDNIYGVDINAQSVEITRLSLFLLTASRGESLPDLSHSIVAGDSVSNGGLDWEEAFPGVFGGDMPGFSVIIGNPPFVRHEDMAGATKGAGPPQHARMPPLALGDGFEVPRTTDLSCYFYYHSLSNLAEGGRLGFISSDGWLHSDYGLSLQRAILDNAEITSIVIPEFSVFKDADVNTAVVLLKRGRPPEECSVELARARSAHDFDMMRPDAVSHREQGAISPGNWNSLFHGDIAEPTAPMQRMDEGGAVRRGVVTGNAGFFVLGRDSMAENGIGLEYASPHVTGGDSPVLVDGNAESYLLNVDDGKGTLARRDGGAAVLRYIEKGEATEAPTKKEGRRTTALLPDLPTMSSRRFWYSLSLDKRPPSPIFLSRIINDRIRVYENRGTYRATNTFVSYTPEVASHARAFMAYFASSWFGLQLERCGNPMGGGALSVEVKNFNPVPVPRFKDMPEEAVSDLGKAWELYCETLDRDTLDDTVLGTLGFGDTEKASVKDELARLVSLRLARRRGSPCNGNGNEEVG